MINILIILFILAIYKIIRELYFCDTQKSTRKNNGEAQNASEYEEAERKWSEYEALRESKLYSSKDNIDKRLETNEKNINTDAQPLDSDVLHQNSVDTALDKEEIEDTPTPVFPQQNYYDENECTIKLYNPANMTNKELFAESLQELGCKAETVEDGVVLFRYQGETFSVRFNGHFIRIWDHPFMKVNVLDTNLSLIMEAINTVNFGFGPVIVMSDADEEGYRSVASRMDLLFFSHIPKPASYLEGILAMFFEMKHELTKIINDSLSPSESTHGSTLGSSTPFQN